MEVQAEIKPSLTSSAGRSLLSLRLRQAPWWLIAIGLLALGTVYLINSQPSFGEAFSFIRAGLAVTLITSAVAYAIALLLGLLAGLGRISSNPLSRNLATFYVEMVRGIPMMVLIFFIALVLVPGVMDGLQRVGVLLQNRNVQGFGGWLAALESRSVTMNLRAVIALSITYGAFLAEIFRAGIQSVGTGQMEAARSQGMNYWQAMRFIIMPQAFRNMLPALGNDFISLLKDSSLVSVLAVRDITQVARLYAGQSFRFEEAYTILAVLYLMMTLLLSALVKFMEKRYGRAPH